MFIAAVGTRFGTRAELDAWRDSAESRGLETFESHASAGLSLMSFEHRAWPSARRSHVSLVDGTALAFDGVLHYREELRSRLQLSGRWQGGDAELASIALQQRGERACEILEGAFVVASGGRGHLTIINDCIGAQRLYFAQIGESLVYGTDLPALLSTPGLDTTIDGRSIAQLLGGLIPRGRTGFRAVRALPGGCVMNWQPGKLKVTRWWEPSTTARSRLEKPDEAASRLAGLFENAVEQWLGGSSPTAAATLSGGLDSTLSACFAARRLQQNGGELHAFTSVPQPNLTLHARQNWDSSDWPIAHQVAESYSNVRHASVFSGTPFLLDSLADFHEQSAAPVRNAANCQWLGKIAQEAASLGSAWILTGFRGNYSVSCGRRNEARRELLLSGQWGRLFEDFQKSPVKTPLWRSLASTLKFALAGPALEAWESRRQFYSYAPVARKYLSPEMKEAAAAMIEQLESVNRQTSWKMLQMNTAFSPHFRAQFGVEFCDPTADRRVVEAIFQLPDSVFLHEGHDRALARLMGKGVVPPGISWRQTRGQQSPEEASYFRRHATRYRSAWAEMDKEAISSLVNPRALEGLLELLIAGEGDLLQAQFMHRCFDVAMWMHHAESQFGSRSIVFEESCASDINESLFA